MHKEIKKKKATQRFGYKRTTKNERCVEKNIEKRVQSIAACERKIVC